jgi:phosphomannomutase
VTATPVGEIHVAKKMLEIGAVIGGEGNGGVMLPDIHIGRDAPVAATLALQLLASFKGTISQLKLTLPQYEIAKISV